ncbi:MAG: diaminopimelate decarboxylase [Clostridiaceae bacterium]|jgi:diaminopimelate decarboxylase|nr:diaminopimelate decarboxylase [Clostridiaceae bacterium]
MKLFGSMHIENNNLYIGEINSLDLAKEFGTPLYVFDEEHIRNLCKTYYKEFIRKEKRNRVAYAGKAFLTKAMCQLIMEEGLCLDVVSGGELYTAYKSGFPMKNIYFHGNNKTIDEISMAIDLGVGKFVVDSSDELYVINEICKQNNTTQNILLRITPGIEAHTHDYIKTGQLDSKFGFAMINDNITNIVKQAINLSNIKLVGLHCHIGSQIFESEPYEDEIEIMFNLVKKIEEEFHYHIDEVDLGGGFGVYYKRGDKPLSIEKICNVIIDKANKVASDIGINVPSLTIEPGRSIVANSGITIYTVGTLKSIPGIKNYAAVDGGMTDNIRPALYNADYESLVCNKANEECLTSYTVAGKCCESGDILIDSAVLPKLHGGDILAILNTGAYGYSMASNYNKIPKPAVVFVKNSEVKLICKRESYEDIIKNELDI